MVFILCYFTNMMQSSVGFARVEFSMRNVSLGKSACNYWATENFCSAELFIGKFSGSTFRFLLLFAKMFNVFVPFSSDWFKSMENSFIFLFGSGREFSTGVWRITQLYKKKLLHEKLCKWFVEMCGKCLVRETVAEALPASVFL